MQMLAYTKDENRDRFNGILGLITGIVSLLLPVLCGYLIQAFPNFTGYRIVFGISAGCIVASLFFTMGLDIPVSKNTISIGSTLKCILRNGNCMRCIIANALAHCRGSVLNTFLTMLVYNIISNEAVIGLQSSLSNIASLVSIALYGIFIRSSNRTKGSLLAMGLVLLPCAWMLFEVNVLVLLVFSVVYTFAGTFIDTPISFTYFKSVETLNLHGDAGAAVQLAADIFVAIITNAGFLLIAVVPKTNYWAVALVVAMTLTSVVSTLLIHKTDKKLNLQEKT
jgi:YQGE family putative transporter